MNTDINLKEIYEGARWAKKHSKYAHSNLNIRFDIISIPTEIATAYHIKCKECGLEQDITDYKSW